MEVNHDNYDAPVILQWQHFHYFIYKLQAL